MTSVTQRLHPGAAASTQRHHRAISANQLSVNTLDGNVAPHQDGTTGVHADGGRIGHAPARTRLSAPQNQCGDPPGSTRESCRGAKPQHNTGLTGHRAGEEGFVLMLESFPRAKATG